ncbi:uncharacterized protein LOC119835861 [Zerene cesonia]|uniref:uncharacterized protein LOC119835861 n=1 Tax=Zerene cesonia TaxID=33412 RepID=UPI0018E5A48B|nr:uncharacterized protein LOC119835861 [Zerene cesonia]
MEKFENLTSGFASLDLRDPDTDVIQEVGLSSPLGQDIKLLRAEISKFRTEMAVSCDIIETVDQLRKRLNDSEQQQLLNDVCISGVPEANGENLTHIVISLAQKLSFDLDERDIVNAHRLGRQQNRRESGTDTAVSPARPRTIMVRLTRRRVRDELLRAARVRRGADTAGTGIGGLWEAGVKSCKHHLKRVVGNAHLTLEEFSTILIQVEAVLNSRPLTYLSTDPNDFLPLSPAHFLVGRPLTAPVTAQHLYDVPELRLPRFQRVEQIHQHFWNRWSKEYVSEMQTRTKWHQHKGDLKENTLVLIKDDRLPPLKWSLGRIHATYPGKDGVARVADIRTADGIVRRAFTKICPLPSPDS